MNVLAQQEHYYGGSGFSRILESAPSHEIMVMVVVGIVFSTMLMIVLTVCVTNTIRSIKTASINSRLTEKLVKEGLSCEQIERLVRANSRRFYLPGIPAKWKPSKWQKAESLAQTTPGKPMAPRPIA